MRMTYTRCFLGFLLLALVLGCGDGMAPPANISVSVAPTTASLLTGVSQDFTAMVANERGAKGVTWSITGCTGGPPVCGALSNVTSTAATYTAPAPILSDAQLGITARSVTDNTKAFTVTVAITAIRVSVSPASGSVAVNGTRLFTAMVANDPTHNGVTWSFTGCAGGAAVCGSLTNVTNTSATYTAPPTVPPGALGVTATSMTDNSKSFTATVAVTAIAVNGQIAFLSNREGYYEIYAINADGSGQVDLTNNPATDWEIAWSPDGSKIAFTSSRDRNWEIYVMNADGSGQVNLTNNSAPDYLPAWSPDGQKIAFASERDGNGEIYVMNADGSGLVNLTYYPATDYEPAWSPDGRKIAFVSLRDNGNPEVYVMNADGSGVTGLTRATLYVNRPIWSPDGTRIAFEVATGTCHSVGCPRLRNIYVMSADGSGLVNLTDNPAVDNAGAAWSPDGSKIVFYTNRDGNYEIYAVNVDGSGSTRLTNDPAYDVSPAWSPDGSHIAFESTRGGIYVMNADGSAVVGLTTGGSVTSPSDPTWRPW